VTGKYGVCYFLDRFLCQTCLYVYIMLLVFFVCVCFVLCRERRRRDGSRHRLIMERAKTDEISALSLLSSYLRQKVSKEGQLSYPNFIQGPLFGGVQLSYDHFEVFCIHCCTIREVP